MSELITAADRKSRGQRESRVGPRGASAQHLEGGVVHEEFGGHHDALRPEQPHPAGRRTDTFTGTNIGTSSLLRCLLLLRLLRSGIRGGGSGERQRAAEVLHGGHREAPDERRVGHELTRAQVHVPAHTPERCVRLRLQLAVRVRASGLRFLVFVGRLLLRLWK